MKDIVATKPESGNFPEQIKKLLDHLRKEFDLTIQERAVGGKHYVILTDGSMVPSYLFSVLSRAIDSARPWKLSEGCIHLTRDFLKHDHATTALYAEEGIRGGLGNHALPVRLSEDDSVLVFDITILQPFHSIHADQTQGFILALHNKEKLLSIIEKLYGGHWKEISKNKFMTSFHFRD